MSQGRKWGEKKKRELADQIGPMMLFMALTFGQGLASFGPDTKYYLKGERGIMVLDKYRLGLKDMRRTAEIKEMRRFRKRMLIVIGIYVVVGALFTLLPDNYDIGAIIGGGIVVCCYLAGLQIKADRTAAKEAPHYYAHYLLRAGGGNWTEAEADFMKEYEADCVAKRTVITERQAE